MKDNFVFHSFSIKTQTRNRWITRGWTNNNAESYNHKLKQKTQWKKLSVPNLIKCIYDLVCIQTVDLKRALHGEGDYTLVHPFDRYAITYSMWVSMSDERKASHLAKYLADNGRRYTEQFVQSSDGVMRVLNTPKTARKPGQKIRSRKARTISITSR